MLSRDPIRDRNGRPWIARIAALLALVAVAVVFIAPDVDLLDSTCDQTTVMLLLLQVPAVAVTAPETFTANQARGLLHTPEAQSSAAAPRVLSLTCAWIC